MMRLRLASLVLVLASASLLLGGVGTGFARPRGASSSTAWRTWTLSASPSPGDLELVEIHFHGSAGRRRISRAALTLSVSAPFGDDYVTAVTPSLGPSRSLRAFVLIVNRPSALLDPARVRVRLRSARVLGTPASWRILDPLTHPGVGLTPALCDLPLHGAPALSAPMLRPLGSRGGALTGFGSTSAVAQAYDLICGLPHLSSFEQAVRGAGSCRPVGSLCCPPTAICATPTPPTPTPTPAPPTPPAPGPPPSCTPCSPPPGYACPLVAPRVCPAVLPAAARRAPAGAH